VDQRDAVPHAEHHAHDAIVVAHPVVERPQGDGGIGLVLLPGHVAAALFAANDKVLVALSRDPFYEKPLTIRATGSSERICLPEGSGPQIAALAAPDLLLFAERRCNSSGGFTGSNRLVAPASLYGVNAYAIAYDPAPNFLYVTERAGYLTIYRVPRAAVVK